MRRSERDSNRRGNALVEFAIAFTFISVLFTGVFQFGYTFYLYNNLLTNIRAGARYAAQKSYTPGPGTTVSNPVPQSAYVAAVKNMVVYGTPNPTDASRPVVPDLTTANVEVVPSVDSNGIPQSITVRISRANPFTINAVVASKRLVGKPSVTFQYTGIYSAVP
ncbi:MAG TPA: TadE family protein [Bryobacteraceae bacterium]|nr:TadE family protein [Bryobacteraceae bacterium]